MKNISSNNGYEKKWKKDKKDGKKAKDIQLMGGMKPTCPSRLMPAAI